MLLINTLKGYYGDICENIHPCNYIQNICKNNGVCFDIGGGNYSCSCKLGWFSGKHCIQHLC